MTIEKIKKKFIKFMEEIFQGKLFPRNYFKIMMAVLVEQKSINQDRIAELAETSKTTISQIINLLQMSFPMKIVKKPKNRRSFYTFTVSTRECLLILFKNISKSYLGKMDFVLPIIEDLESLKNKHIKFQILQKFLIDFYEWGDIYNSLFQETIDVLNDLVNKDQLNEGSLIRFNNLSTTEYLDQINKLIQLPYEISSDLIPHFQSEDLASKYLNMKNTFFENFKSNLQVNASQFEIARIIISMELILEQRPLSQLDIENSTNFARSIISDTLNSLLGEKRVQEIKKPQDRKKYYILKQSWIMQTLHKIDMEIKKIVNVKENTLHLIGESKKESDSEEKTLFILFLADVRYCFTQFERYFKFLEMKYLNERLNEQSEK